ncbi:uncharacterized protein LOC127798662 [Diospyros lotus]|uniref:uncharacterized protein LOC127798662 n=1 Tax=Diospyros lotus TaxID=55363 RepID=UPI00225895C3|nr:uncharacterized protein LOC127798662 [Diospyros lotus]
MAAETQARSQVSEVSKAAIEGDMREDLAKISDGCNGGDKLVDVDGGQGAEKEAAEAEGSNVNGSGNQKDDPDVSYVFVSWSDSAKGDPVERALNGECDHKLHALSESNKGSEGQVGELNDDNGETVSVEDESIAGAAVVSVSGSLAISSLDRDDVLVEQQSATAVIEPQCMPLDGNADGEEQKDSNPAPDLVKDQELPTMGLEAGDCGTLELDDDKLKSDEQANLDPTAESVGLQKSEILGQEDSKEQNVFESREGFGGSSEAQILLPEVAECNPPLVDGVKVNLDEQTNIQLTTELEANQESQVMLSEASGCRLPEVDVSEVNAENQTKLELPPEVKGSLESQITELESATEDQTKLQLPPEVKESLDSQITQAESTESESHQLDIRQEKLEEVEKTEMSLVPKENQESQLFVTNSIINGIDEGSEVAEVANEIGKPFEAEHANEHVSYGSIDSCPASLVEDRPSQAKVHNELVDDGQGSIEVSVSTEDAESLPSCSKNRKPDSEIGNKLVDSALSYSAKDANLDIEVENDSTRADRIISCNQTSLETDIMHCSIDPEENVSSLLCTDINTGSDISNKVTDCAYGQPDAVDGSNLEDNTTDSIQHGGGSDLNSENEVDHSSSTSGRVSSYDAAAVSQSNVLDEPVVNDVTALNSVPEAVNVQHMGDQVNGMDGDDHSNLTCQKTENTGQSYKDEILASSPEVSTTDAMGDQVSGVDGDDHGNHTCQKTENFGQGYKDGILAPSPKVPTADATGDQVNDVDGDDHGNYKDEFLAPSPEVSTADAMGDQVNGVDGDGHGNLTGQKTDNSGQGYKDEILAPSPEVSTADARGDQVNGVDGVDHGNLTCQKTENPGQGYKDEILTPSPKVPTADAMGDQVNGVDGDDHGNLTCQKTEKSGDGTKDEILAPPPNVSTADAMGDQVNVVDGDDCGNRTVQQTEITGQGCKDEILTPSPEVSTADAMDDSVGIGSLKKPFPFLIKIPRYDDENLREQIRQAQMQVDEKTRQRDAIGADVQMIRAGCQKLHSSLGAAKLEERAARGLVRLKRQEIDSVQSVINRVKNAMSVEDIDTRIHSMEHMIQHETLPLKEEKQFIREIKQLKHLREELSSNMGSQDEVQQALNQRDHIEERMKILKKELDLLKDKVSKAEAIALAAGKKYSDETKHLKELHGQFRTADDIRQKAYAHLQNLRRQLYEKNTRFRMCKDDTAAANDYALSGKKEELYRHCVNQVEAIMELWNKNDEFRKEYIRCNTKSTLRRLRTLDGRALGPNEEPIVLPNVVDEKVDRSSSISGNVDSDFPVLPAGQEKQASAMESEETDSKPVATVTKQMDKTAKATQPGKPTLRNGLATDSGRDESEEMPEEEHKKTKEEQELARKEEELRKEEAAAKLKEQRRLEEKVKAMEALERKRKNAEKALIRAEMRAQKEAEQKEKERQKRAKKKEKRKGTPTETLESGKDEGETALKSESADAAATKELEAEENNNSTTTKRHQKSFQYSKQIKTKSIPPPLRNRGKRKMQQWIWIGFTVLLVILLFLLVNVGFYSNLGRNLRMRGSGF